MADLSLQLPAWAVQKGYRAEGDFGTYGDLMLLKDGGMVKAWPYYEQQPNIFEMEEFIREYENEGEEALSRC
jgi:hypothetical protein